MLQIGVGRRIWHTGCCVYSCYCGSPRVPGSLKQGETDQPGENPDSPMGRLITIILPPRSCHHSADMLRWRYALSERSQAEDRGLEGRRVWIMLGVLRAERMPERIGTPREYVNTSELGGHTHLRKVLQYVFIPVQSRLEHVLQARGLRR